MSLTSKYPFFLHTYIGTYIYICTRTYIHDSYILSVQLMVKDRVSLLTCENKFNIPVTFPLNIISILFYQGSSFGRGWDDWYIHLPTG